MNRTIRIFFLLVALTSTIVSGVYAQFEEIPDSIYIAQLSKLDKTKLYKVALLAENPFLCMNISTDNYCGEAVVRLEDYRQWYFQHFDANNESFLTFSMPKLLGDTLFVSDKEMVYNRVRDIPMTDNLKEDLDSCLSLCNNGLFDYDLIASLFHSNILIERMEDLEDDARPYIRFPFYYYNGTATPFQQTNKILNESLLLFLDSINLKNRFYLEINDEFEPSRDFILRYGDLLIQSYPSLSSKLIKKIPDNSQIVSLDSFRVFDGDCILTYKLFVVKMVSFKGKRKKVAVGTRFIEYRFTYAKEQLDWTLKSIRSFDF